MSSIAFKTLTIAASSDGRPPRDSAVVVLADMASAKVAGKEVVGVESVDSDGSDGGACCG